MTNLSWRIEWTLRQHPATRSSDKLLLWKIVAKDKDSITYQDFLNAPPVESVTRCRRKLQEQHPELRAVKEVEEQRNLNAIKMQAWSIRDKQEALI